MMEEIKGANVTFRVLPDRYGINYFIRSLTAGSTSAQLLAPFLLNA